MIGKIEYLEKYSVAPPPSRDYYGLKILQDELILYIWKISHGPHKTPISRIIKFVEFSQDKTLQDFIGRFFGEHFVNYIQKLAEGKGNTLLTLPRSSIRKIVEFLHFKDIVNLSSLSRIANVVSDHLIYKIKVQVFNDNFIWETLYKRHKRFNISKKEIEYAMAYGWKQTFKDQQIPFSAELRKITGSTIKNEHLKMKNGLSRSMSGPLKTLPKVSNSSVSNEIVRPLQITQKNAQTNLIKSLKNNKVNDDTIKNNRNDKKINVNVKKINKTNKTNKTSNTKKEKSTKNDEVRESFSDSMSIAGQQNSSTNKRNTKSVVTTVKTINGNLHITEKDKFFGDTKKNNVINKNTMNKTNNGVSSNSQSIKNKTLSKNNKTKTKKLMESNSTILNTDKSFINESAVMKNENFELAYLIEESLKRIRSPRTVFDYDYSYLEDAKTLTDSTKKNKTMNTMKDIKRDRINKKLDRLSENSDSMTTLSNNSIENMKLNESDRSTNKISTKEKNTLFDKKIIVDRNEMLEPVTDLNENSPKISPKIIDETDTKYCIPKGALNSIDIMKSLRSSNPMIRSTALSGKNLPTTATNRFALRKSFNELRKDRIMQDN
ncbi:PREDICTED: TNF receptor-associated factor family protein DDB_G0272098-like [Polistes dominula]|uniref:TNF receptor-associated factor family protein DDB_G0272098-like n=1 Tax=Polistes dominula TaxID=743375 RepID=A0ABM1ISU8_POLDO|nr:PREDICTED: TNF receptor-associated factor family protein DDB_G0272098-like [Polistes dominula]